MLAHELKLHHLGFAMLPVYIKPKNIATMIPTDYKVDTGANCTTIGNKRLNELGYDNEWIKSRKLLEGDARPTVASGLPVDNCYEVVLSEIRIGD